MHRATVARDLPHPAPRRSARPLAALAAALALALPACRDAGPRPITWPESPVVYGVVPSLFGDAPLRAVTERLDQLRHLGVDALWLAPLQETDDPSEISYSITDYRRLRADLGSDEDLRALVRAAHERGMRVLLDFVPNHTSKQHPYFQDAATRGEASPYWGWYRRDADGAPVHRFDWDHLPELDYARPEVRRMMIDAFVHWVEVFDVDGFRVDAAWAIRERAPDFWPELRAALERVKPGLFLLAEAGALDPYYLEHGFDAAYDWSPEIGHWAWEDAFSDLATAGPKLARALEAIPADAPRARTHVARFLDNNDTGARFVTRHGVAATRVAAVLQLTLPGIPVLYTGEEVGAEYQPYDDPPKISWVDRHGFTPLYRRLTRLRGRLPALRHGSYATVDVGAHPSAFAFARNAGPEGRALVVLELGKSEDLSLALDTVCGGEWWDELSGRPVQLRASSDGRVHLGVQATSAMVLTPMDPCGAGASASEASATSPGTPPTTDTARPASP